MSPVVEGLADFSGVSRRQRERRLRRRRATMTPFAYVSS